MEEIEVSHLALYLLGAPRVERDGVPLHIRRRKTLALLAYLVVTERRHSRDTLATLFYPKHDQRGARGGLRRTLSTLRNALGEGWLDADAETVALHRDAGPSNGESPRREFWLDVAAFQDLLVQARSHSHPPDQVCPACLRLLTEAVTLYRDDFLAGFTLRDSPGFDDWQSFQTQSLSNQLASALGRLAFGYGGQGQFKQAIVYARRCVALDPLNEPAQRCLMQLYASSGQRAAALQQYAECEKALQQELNVTPQEATLQLLQAIQEGGAPPTSIEQVAPPVAAQAAARKHNLPVQLTPFVGREALLAEIATRLGDPTCRLMTLVGPGGCGKTRLAIEAAAGRIDRYGDGVYLVPLAAVDSTDAIVPSIAATLGFSFYSEGKGAVFGPTQAPSPKQQLLDYLRGRHLLLILDNFEHLLDRPEAPPGRSQGARQSKSIDLVSEMLRAAPGLQILVTSRSRLDAECEHLLPIDGMEYPIAAAADVERYGAIRLFVQSAHRTRPDFALSPDNRADIVDICRRVHGIPLAILLAATCVGMLTLAEIARELGPALGVETGTECGQETSKSLDFLGMELRDLPPRQRSMRAVFDRSWDLLTARERAVMECLSVFRGGFTQGAAQLVAGASLHDLVNLVHKSLLQRMLAPTTASFGAREGSYGTEGRYQVHELLRQYAAEKLAGDPKASKAAHDRHCAYYAAALERWNLQLEGAGQQTALREIEREIENMRTAWEWAVESRQVGRLAQALDGLCRFYEWRVRFQEGEAACQSAAYRLEGTTAGEGLRVLARIKTWQSALNQHLGEIQLASQLVRQSLALLERPELDARDTCRETALALLQRGRLAHAAGDLSKARQWYALSKALSEESGDRWITALTLYALGKVAWERGAFDQARSLLAESLAIRRALGDHRGVASSLASLALVSTYQGYTEQAERLVWESLAIHRELGDHSDLSLGLNELGVVLVAIGKFTEAREMLAESLAIHNRLGYRRGIADSNRVLGLTNLILGRYEVARAHAQVCLDIAQDLCYLQGIGTALGVLAACAVADGAHAEALELFQKSALIFREIEQRDDLSLMLVGSACAELWLGQLHQAERHLSQALHIAAKLRNWFPLPYALPVAVLLLVKQGQVERALELQAMISRFPAFVESRLIEDNFGRHVTAAAADLPPDVVAAARERGEARDPVATLVELLIELDVARFLPGPLNKLGRLLARILGPLLTPFLGSGSQRPVRP
jgi:predicted ATPase/DNA-binding SARP family transcriptional activator